MNDLDGFNLIVKSITRYTIQPSIANAGKTLTALEKSILKSEIARNIAEKNIDRIIPLNTARRLIMNCWRTKYKIKDMIKIATVNNPNEYP
jgi:hypothetical protein